MAISKSAWGVVLENDSIMFLRRSATANNGGLWNVSGGGIEGKESPKKAVVRELWEEAGLKPKDIKLLGSFQIKVLEGSTTREINVFFFEKVGGAVKINHESDRVLWEPVANLNRLNLKKIHHTTRWILVSNKFLSNVDKFLKEIRKRKDKAIKRAAEKQAKADKKASKKAADKEGKSGSMVPKVNIEGKPPSAPEFPLTP